MEATVTENALAFQILAALESYQEGVKKLVATWLDMELYAVVSRELEAVRLHAASMPAVAVGWITVLISHTELIHALWRTGQAPAAPSSARDQLLGKHLKAIEDLRRSCLHLLHT